VDLALSRQYCCCCLQGLRLLLSTQHTGDVLKSCESEVSTLAQILFATLPAMCKQGIPVLVTALFSFSVGCKVASLSQEDQGGYLV